MARYTWSKNSYDSVSVTVQPGSGLASRVDSTQTFGGERLLHAPMRPDQRRRNRAAVLNDEVLHRIPPDSAETKSCQERYSGSQAMSWSITRTSPSSFIAGGVTRP